MKPLLLALCITLIAALVIGTCGCTSSSNTSSSSSFQTLTVDNLAGAINDKYTAENYTVNTPFKMTKQNNTITYKGVVTDGSKVATPYKRNITIVLTPDRTVAWATYNNTIKQQQAKGYQKFSSSNTAGNVYWVGYFGTAYSSNPATAQVRDDLQDPSSIGLILPGASTHLYVSNADLSNNFEIMSNEQTAV